MSEKNKKTPIVKTPIQTFAHRNIKKEFQKFKSLPSITAQKHLELTENNGTKIVDDRNVDWFELAQKDADSVGLANILALASKNKMSIAQFAMKNAADLCYKDSEAADLSMIDPMNPDKMQKLAESKEQSYAKLQSLAKQLDISVDTLLESVISGGLEKIIASKLEAKKQEGSEVKENA